MNRIITLTTKINIRDKIRISKNMAFLKLKYNDESSYKRFAKLFNASLKKAYDQNKISKDEFEEYKLK